MKKFIYSLLVMAMAAFTFSSCEDVPAPYDLPNQPETPSVDPNAKGSENNPYTVGEAIALIQAGTAPSSEVCVKGKITAVTYYNATYKSISYNIADEGSSEVLEVYSGKGLNGADFSAKTDLSVGQTVVVKGKIKAFTKTDGTVVNEIDQSSTIISIEGENTPDTPTTGKGSESDPYTITEGIALIKSGNAPSTEVCVKGKITAVTYYNATYKSISYNLADEGSSEVIEVYSGKGLNGADFNSKEDLKVGQVVVVKGILKAFTKTDGTVVNEIDKSSTIISIEGEGGSVTPTPTPTDGMNITAIINGKTSANELGANGSYGSQKVEDPATWYTWKYDGIEYQGVRISQASEANGAGIQIQGHATDAGKQGFFFNSTAFSKDIKSITIVVRGAAKYADPTVFNVYGGTEAHPVTTAIKGTYTKVTEGDFNIFTFTYDFSTVSNKYFTVWNNAVGALYIDKVEVTLK